MMPVEIARPSSGGGENAIYKNSLPGESRRRESLCRRKRLPRCAMVAAMLAASGSAARVVADTWYGNTSNTWDTTTTGNWDSGSFNNGDSAVFDDSQTSVFNINITPGGVWPDATSIYLYNSDSFTFSGGPIGSFYQSGSTSDGAFDMFDFGSGNTGTVVLDNSAVYATSYYVDSGQALVVGPGTQLNFPYSRTAAGQIQSVGTITVASGGTLQLQAGATMSAYTVSGLNLVNNGTVEVASGATITGALGNSSVGTVKLDGGGATWISQYGTFQGTLAGSGTYSVTDNPQPGGHDYQAAGLSLQTPSSLQLTSGSALTASNGAYIVLAGASSGSAGYGSGITAYLSGTGYYGPGAPSGSSNKTLPTPAGALQGGSSVANNWLGNVVVPTTIVSGSIPDPTAISGGYGGTLTISGNISGGDPIAFSPQYFSSTILAGSNTYTGETRIASTYLAAGTLALGAANAIPAGSGISFAGGGTSTFNLNGYSTSTAYLTTRAAGGAGYNAVGIGSYTGSNSNNLITNSGASNATLTDVQTGTMTYAGKIKDGTSKVALAFTGSGNQILTATNTFSGGTTISSGTATAGAPAALGTGSVTLSGGTLALAATSPTNAITNFSTTPFTFNQGAGGSGPSASGSTLTLTDSTTTNEANSAFTTSPVTLGAKGFIASFNLSFNAPQYVPPDGYTYSGGVTLTLENDPNGPHAVGGSGYGLGYSGIQNSAALEISTRQSLLTLSQTDANRLGTILQTGGATTDYSTGYNDVRGTNNPQEDYNVTLAYDSASQTLVETLDGGTSNTLSFFYSHIYTGVNLSSILGTSSPYIGFTGGSGGTLNLSVSNFSFSNLTGTTKPTSIANGLTAAASTSSAISLGTSAGNLGATVGSITVGTNATLAVSSVSSDGTTTPGVLTTPSASIGAGGTLNFAASANALVNGALSNAGNLVLNGAGSNSLVGVDGAGTVSVGSLSTLNVSNHVNQTAIVSSGTITIAGGATNVIGQGNGTGTGAGGTSTTGGISGAGTLTVNGTANLYSSQITQGNLNIGSSSTVTIADSAAPGNNASVSVLTDLSNSGTLDLKNNDLIVNDPSQYTSVKAQIISAQNGGNWNQPGITSSSAAANHLTGLGYGQVGTGSGQLNVSSFDGQPVSSGATLVKYTLYGDLLLTGSVTATDFNIILPNYNKAVTGGWSQGDLFGTGQVTAADFNAMLPNYNKSDSTLSPSVLVSPALSVAKTSAVSRSLSVSPALTLYSWDAQLPNAQNGQVVLKVDDVTTDSNYGDVILQGNNVTIDSLHITSASGKLQASTTDTKSHYNSFADQSAGTDQSTDSGGHWSLINATTTDVYEAGIDHEVLTFTSNAESYDMGKGTTVAKTSAPAWGVSSAHQLFVGLAGDLTATYGDLQGNTDPITVEYLSSTQSTPEPASLGVLAAGGVMMMRRRRTPAKAKAIA